MILVLSGRYGSGKTVLAKAIIKAAGKTPLYLPHNTEIANPDYQLPEDEDGYYLLDNVELSPRLASWLKKQSVDVIVTTITDTDTVLAGLPVWRLERLHNFIDEESLYREEVRPLR